MKIILTIISTGILVLVPAHSEPLQRCAEHSVVPKGSSSNGVKRVQKFEDKTGVKDEEENDSRLQKYVHRSTADESLENESLARRYIPYKLGSNGVNWYRRKAAHKGRRDFGNPRLRAMEDEESEDGVLPTEPGSRISDSLIPEESTDENAMAERGWHVDKIPPGVEILGERKPVEVEKSETDLDDLEAQARIKKGKKKKKKKRPHKKRPRPTVPPSSQYWRLERRVGDEEVDSSQDDAAVAKIVQQILGLERAYGKRYTDQDFGQVKTPARIRARPADSEPIYLV